MSLSTLRTRLTPHTTALSFLASSALLLIGVSLLMAHVSLLHLLQEHGLPAAVELPTLQRKLTILHQQLEAADLQDALVGGATEESLHVFTLPAEPTLDRTLALFDVLRDDFQKQRLLFSLSPIQAGEVQTVTLKGGDGQKATVQATPLTLQATLTREGADRLLLLLRLSGLLTVSDTLSPEQLHKAVILTEQENPAALTSLEQFLSTDLLRFALDPKPWEEQLFRSIPSEQFQQGMSDLLAHSALAKARYLLKGQTGQMLTEHHLWPLPLLTIDAVEETDLGPDRVQLSLHLSVYAQGRGK